MGMLVASELGPHLLAELRRLVDLAKERQREYFCAKYGEAGIVSEPIAEHPFAGGVAVSLGQLQTF